MLLLVTGAVCAQGSRVLSGQVTNASGDPLPGANVYFKSTLQGTTTDRDGKFTLPEPPGTDTLVFSFLGFEDREILFEPGSTTTFNVALREGAITTREAVVTGEKANRNVDRVAMGRAELNMREVKLLPAFMGEVDILKTIQLLPGVQAAGDGNTGFYVRGGGPDQNLILMDGATIYNPSHILGFFSTFNANSVDEVELIKGGMPAQYGGRLASVLDVSMREGNMDEFHVDGGIGLVASRLTVEGPIKKGKSSFIVSGRRTYADILIRPFVPDTSQLAESQYYFYDLNAKLRWNVNSSSYFTLTGYFGRDVFEFQGAEDDDFGARIPWGNAVASLQYVNAINSRFSMKATLMFTDYDFRFSASQSDFDLELFSGIRDYKARVDFGWLPTARHSIKFGGEITRHEFTPSNVSAEQGTTDFDIDGVKSMTAYETAIWINDEWDVTTNLRVSAGLRYTSFAQIGAFTRYTTDAFDQITDTTSYGSGEIVAFYHGLEPRVSARYTINSQTSVKAAITRNLQYLHLANFSTLALPTDLWLPSSDVVEPQIGTEYAIGLFRNFQNNTFETSVEVYYKTMDNMVEYEEGTFPSDDVGTNPDNSLTFGRGWAYGIEFFVKKRFGRMNGWVGYTLARTMREFEEINDGNPYPATYDRRHDISAALTYEFNERWTFSTTFVYGTGAAITLPVSRYTVEGRIVSEYGERNSFRMPSYHRLDVAATLKGKEREKFENSWTFAIYNLYNRANPFFIYFDSEGRIDDGSLRLVAKQVSLFPILPSVTYNFRF